MANQHEIIHLGYVHLVEYSGRFVLPRVARSLTESSEGCRWERLGIIDENIENSLLSRRENWYSALFRR